MGEQHGLPVSTKPTSECQGLLPPPQHVQPVLGQDRSPSGLGWELRFPDLWEPFISFRDDLSKYES